MCVFAGIGSSALGIGGGMVTGPLMLHLGALPAVSVATASFMIVPRLCVLFSLEALHVIHLVRAVSCRG